VLDRNLNTKPIDIAVILVGRDSALYLGQALKSLPTADWGSYSYEIIYVDNGSKDRTRAMLKEHFPHVRTVLNSGNYGFCRAANQGARLANSRYLFFLNDDTVVLGAAIRKLAEALDTSDEMSAIGSRLLYPDESEQYSGRKFPTPLNGLLGRRSVLTRFFPKAKAVRRYLFKDQLAGKVPFEVDWVSAAAMMVRAGVFRGVGGFAEDYYYFHECVLADRMKKAGHRTYLHPESKIIHYEGFGSGPRPLPIQKWHIVDFHRGAFRFYCEHRALPFLSLRRAFAAAAMSFRGATLLLAKAIASLIAVKRGRRHLAEATPPPCVGNLGRSSGAFDGN
jgi:N-acetylglucosaminyl-diphospho-decaprenol L-rhamnosyltransferase